MINLLYIDLFCGAGGTTSGINTARLDGEKCAKVIACVNHANAIPEDYVLIGTQAEQKKFIGNAVEVTIARKWCEALCSSVRDIDIDRYRTSKVA